MQRAFVTICLVLLGGAGLIRAQEKRPEPLPKELVAAWEKAGAQTGWM